MKQFIIFIIILFCFIKNVTPCEHIIQANGFGKFNGEYYIDSIDSHSFLNGEDHILEMVYNNNACIWKMYDVVNTFPYYTNTDCSHDITTIDEPWILNINQSYSTISDGYIFCIEEPRYMLTGELHIVLLIFAMGFFVSSLLCTNLCCFVTDSIVNCTLRLYTIINETVFRNNEHVDRMGRIRGTHGVGEPCVVCLDDMEITQRRIQLKCNHVFHVDCILNWFSVKPECPIDRIQISSFNECLLVIPDSRMPEPSDTNGFIRFNSDIEERISQFRRIGSI